MLEGITGREHCALAMDARCARLRREVDAEVNALRVRRAARTKRARTDNDRKGEYRYECDSEQAHRIPHKSHLGPSTYERAPIKRQHRTVHDVT